MNCGEWGFAFSISRGADAVIESGGIAMPTTTTTTMTTIQGRTLAIDLAMVWESAAFSWEKYG